MKLKKLFANLGILAVSVGFGLLVCELASRLVLNPADYLSVAMVKDDVLGAVPAPGTSGFDRWGFRNPTVPRTADIVAIGDSHTYGNTARMSESWPYVLARLTGEHVYNMGMGGYGPNQYLYLLQTRALILKPRLVICGLWLGDDFENAFTITYGLDHWAYLRKLPVDKVNFDIWNTSPPRASLQKKIRIWLSRHSVIYQLAVHASLAGRLQGQLQIKNAAALNSSATSLVVPEKHILEAFLPVGMLSRLDQENPNVREGMRITFEVLKEMNEICHQNNAQFLVVVIPTKEMVFSDYLEHNSKVPLDDVLDKVVENQRLARLETFRFMADSAISYVDTLPALKGSLEHELYARTATDIHPNRNGYQVIAEAVFEALKQQGKN